MCVMQDGAKAPRKRTVQRVVDVVEQACAWCGEWFVLTRSDALYCPEPKPCRLKAHRAKRRGLVPYTDSRRD